MNLENTVVVFNQEQSLLLHSESKVVATLDQFDVRGPDFLITMSLQTRELNDGRRLFTYEARENGELVGITLGTCEDLKRLMAEDKGSLGPDEELIETTVN